MSSHERGYSTADPEVTGSTAVETGGAENPAYEAIPAVALETDDSGDGSSISDTDSAIGSWTSTRTQSLTSTVTDFKYENGRRYHAFREGDYHLPNDDEEQDRLDMQHAIYRFALDGRLYLAPLAKEKLHHVLDVGTGTGAWSIDMADENPQAQVLGFDLSPIQPDLVPPNCKFLVDDCNADWLFPEKFDLIHTRAMTPGIRDWSKYLRQAFDNLTPGGYIELHEIHMPARCTQDSASPTPFLVQWSQYVIEAGQKVGLEFSVAKRLHDLLHATGFENIRIEWQHWPVGTWAKGSKNKQIGRWWAEDAKEVTRNTAALFTRVLGWKPEEFEVFAAKIANEIESGKKHMWVELCFAYAQKPLDIKQG
ncbi:hypothetical protein M433DRAFT_169355 [Acidomyces richmondensis BFW]|nr:hypothetical protein M433DRAFT_169355 [Acidomyces richmondensis BFW]